MTQIHFIGGEKGGVGKSVLARLLAQHYIDQQKPFSVFDGDLSHGAMLRHYGDFSEAVDLSQFDSADRIAEKAVESGCDVIVDMAAQTTRPLKRWMEESGIVELGDEVGMQIVLWHVMDDGTDSQRLLGEALTNYGDGPKYVVVRNHGRGGDFSVFNKSAEKQQADQKNALYMDLPALHAATMRKIDREGASFWAASHRESAAGPTLGLMERQRVKIWMKKSTDELARVLSTLGAR